MKILELRFKNINSLYGEWCIDFTDPGFVADGLFAITGATGSGKTTILDALCLALYGQTPRLGKMTASDNEVMSRQTGECFAEVLFEAAQGTYRAAWHQHRSRKKAGGALQSPKREVANKDGTILAEKIKEVQEQVDRITGMSFDRFTRSILLAQGSFDTFLKANADERSPILEQITGTEIYSEISKAVHLRNSAENQTLNELKAGLGGIQLLGAEDLEQIAFDLKQVQEQHDTEAKKRDASKAALDWVAQIKTLSEELEKNRADQEKWNGENKAFESDAERLANAKRARPLDVTHAKLVNLRNSQSKTEIELVAAIETLPALEEQVAIATTTLEASRNLLEEKDAEFQQLAPILKQVRALDTTISERSSSAKTEEIELKKSQTDLKGLQQKEQKNRIELEHHQTDLTAAEDYQKSHAQDATLVGQLAAIFQSLEQLKKLESDQGESREVAKAATTTSKRASENAVKAANTLADMQSTFSTNEATLKKLSEELEVVMAGKKLTDWQVRLTALQLRFKTEQRLSESHKTLAKKIIDAKKAATELSEKQKERDILQREQTLLLQNLQLRQKIENLEAERNELADGQPCPLCGALEHPYAMDLPKPETRSIDKVNAALAQLADQINTRTGQQSAAEALCQTLQASIKTDEAELQNLSVGSEEEAGEIAVRIEQVQELEQKVNDAKAAQDDARNALNKQQLTEQTARQAAETEAEKNRTAEARLTETIDAFGKAESALFQNLEPYGITTLSDVVDQLEARRDHWLLSEKQQTHLKQTTANLQTTLDGHAEQIATHQTRTAEQAETLNAHQDALAQLIDDRQTQFGDRQPDAVEHEIQVAQETARKANETAQDKLNQAGQSLTLARHSIQTLEDNKKETGQQLTESEPLFFQSLETANFVDEAAYLAARLDEAEQNQLEQRADELRQRQTELIAIAAEKARQLQAKREEEHVESSAEELAELVERCNELQQQIGNLKNKIEANETAKTLHASKLANIEKQQTECIRWNTLHELIGSADGKKFRNFAQGLTFELMVSHANRQLAKMSDRYLLIRDIENPLDLNVVDNYQAGEIRPVKNLSGGESFIVSLSLALGLSKMASQHIRVDSLFLDEGFGTLDEDALETALEALAELKQDGKLIGVISHVGALKERIGTQINVHTTSGGRSRLSGTGVSRR